MWSRGFSIAAIVVMVAWTPEFCCPLFAQAERNPDQATRSPSDRSAAKKPSPEDSEGLRDGLVRKLKEALDAAEGMFDQDQDQDRDSVNETLREADATLSRIREENRRALEQVNRQVRLVNHKCPNIVLFLLNGVGYGELGAYGQPLIKTPVADALALHGVRFTQFYAGSCDSIASRGTLYSGKLTARGEQVGEDWMTVREQDVTLPEMLFQGGYETGLFGVWGVGPVARAGHPNRQGFKTFVGYLDDPAAEDLYPSALWCNASQVPLPENRGGARQRYAPDVIVAAARRFIASVSQRPFFLTVALPMPLTADGVELPDLGPYADRDWPTRDKARAAMLTRVDGYLGQIVSELQEQRLVHRTMIILTSDRGPPAVPAGGVDRFQATGPLRGRAGELYEGGIRVPLIVVEPGMRSAPMVSELRFGMWDLLPTLRDVTGTLCCPGALDGVSVAKRWAGPADAPPPLRALLYWERHRGGWAQAVRVDDWKGVRFAADGRWELYDLRTDLAESQDVAASHPAVVKRIDELAKFLQP